MNKTIDDNSKRTVKFVPVNSLKITENSRWRADENLSELMASIKQHGILQPIIIREEDNSIICGNRRYASAVKLGLEKVPVVSIPNISDKELLILNLTENLQRKNINSIEVGRQCDIMLKDSRFKMTLPELATALGIPVTRVNICLKAYKLLPEKFRKNLVHMTGRRNRHVGELPENVVFAILNFSRNFKKLNEKELDLLLSKTAELKINVSHVNLIGHLVNTGMPLKKAIDELQHYRVSKTHLIFLKTELANAMKQEKERYIEHFLKKVLNGKYPNLVQ